MSFFRLRSFGGNRWPQLPETSLAQVWAAYLTLDRTQWLGAEIELLQMAQLVRPSHPLCQARSLLP